MIFILFGILALMLEITKDLRCILGIQQFLTTAAWAVTEKFTKPTQSLRKFLMKMSVSVLSPPFVGGFQGSIVRSKSQFLSP